MTERQELAARHLEEWQTFRKLHVQPCIDTGDEVQAKFVKTLADTLRIAQEAERRALLSGEGMETDGPTEIEWSG